MTNEPTDLEQVFDSFDEIFSPRIVAKINDYDVRVAKVDGEHVWHVHDHTDEFFLVLAGELRIGLREPTGEREVLLPTGSVFTVPRGVEHKPIAAPGTRILMLEPTGTVTTGDRHEDIPGHIRSSTGTDYIAAR
jgi:mannose-6-phosphate isomerase-like protein (cupin superfamily)